METKIDSSNRIAVVDVETTGLSPWRHDRIVEIAIVVISPDGQIHQEYETLVNPDRDVGPTRIHGISSTDVLNAPLFNEIADDVLEILAGVHAIAGHNIQFDQSFLAKEYERSGIAIPSNPLLCTCRLFGRASLAACCEELGIELTGDAHRALIDARATARLVASLLAEDPTIFDQHLIDRNLWPQSNPRRTSCFTRDHSKHASQQPPKFLQRMVGKLLRDSDTSSANTLAYLALIDRVLEDRVVDESEENILVDAAVAWNLTAGQVYDAHRTFIHNLAVAALSDGIVSEAERRDLHAVAKLLGQDDAELDSMLTIAADQLSTVKRIVAKSSDDEIVVGKKVCFTGELSATIHGRPITRDIAESMAEKAGLVVAAGVTKKLDFLVVADPNTQSGKAKKARDYGCRILAENVFWKMIDVLVD